ncbi:hypothetical protein ACFY0A_38640 [Streptomyces sp. NPDC001698]|uniref:hypothetical protein n=1 Tax=unclassified Streptomyces TaxID=2593676 RepID=UPI0036A5C87F
MTAKEIGDVTLLARITDHSQGLVTPALYGVEVTTILAATVDEPDRFARRITHLRSYLGAYTGTFRTGDTVHVAASSSISTTAITQVSASNSPRGTPEPPTWPTSPDRPPTDTELKGTMRP